MEPEKFKGDLNIAGTLFKAHDDILIQRDNVGNRQLIQNFDFKDNRYTGYFNWVDKRLYPLSSNQEGLSGQVVKVSIRQDFLSPFIMDDQEVRALNRESIAQKSGVVMIDGAMEARLNGVLPRTKFLDNWYEVDLENRLFKNLGHPKQDLKIPMGSARFGDFSYYYYLKDSHSLARIDLLARSVPARALLLEVPVHIDLSNAGSDSMGNKFSLLDKLAWTDFLWDTELRLLPIEASNIHEIIQGRNSSQGLCPDTAKNFAIKSDEDIKAHRNQEVNKQRVGRGFR